MCHFITATMSPDGDVDAVAALAKASRLQWQQIESTGIARHLVQGERYFFTTHGMCDCGTDLGARNRSEPIGRPLDPDRKAAKLRKRGWSDAKITRHLEQKLDAQNRRRAEGVRRNFGAGDAERWRTFIGSVLDSNAARVIGLLIHFYNDDVTKELVPIQRSERVPADDLTVDFFESIHEDVLYRFSRRPD